MPDLPTTTVRRWRRVLADEREQAAVYRRLAEHRPPDEREILLALAEAEDRHAAHWEHALGDRLGRPLRASVRMRVLGFLARHLGNVFVLALVQRAEHRARRHSSEAVRADERVHAEVVAALAAHGRARLSGTLRAAVFGANDGLVSNIALVLGVLGGGADPRTVVLTGLAGLLAGALSMAAGEYVSVRSQRELLAASAARDPAELVTGLDLDVNELTLLYRARGTPEDEAQRQARAVLRDGTLAAGSATPVGGAEVVGSGVKAAVSSFVFFCTGAAIPVLPFVLGAAGGRGIVIAALLTGGALMATGAAVGVLSGAPPLYRALRQLLIGTAAAGVTYGLGLLVGATLA
ncbi:MAG: rubrerythrin family protein [Saccharothrix sp.]|nr:rubrerythrin family protein [Saccharothrix sp.]